MSFKDNIEKKAFSKIEIILIIILILILSLLAIYSIRYTKKQGRDFKRISDIRVIQAGLDSYYLNHGEYPLNINLYLGGENSLCLDKTKGFASSCEDFILNIVPADPNGNLYIYSVKDGGKSYIINFLLESTVNELIRGGNCAMPGKFLPGLCQ